MFQKYPKSRIFYRNECEMEGAKFLDEIPTDNLVAMVPDLRLPQLDHLEKDGVTIQCINSSDFVIGKQTNFNGPVTIISCAEVLKQGCHDKCGPSERKLVIEDKVLSESAAKMVQKMAEEKEKLDEWKFSDGQEKRNVPKNFKTYSMIIIICVGLLTVVAVALVVFFRAFVVGQPSSTCTPLPRNACIYTAFSWNGRKIKQLKTPVPYIVISETHDEFCYSVNECLQVVRFLQLNMTSKNLACNFFLGSDGNVYSSRGWGSENSLEGPAAGKSLQICFLGDYMDDYPTFPQSEAAKNLIQFAIDKNYVSKDYVLVASNTISPDDSLGPVLYSVVKKWDHFVENPFS